MRLGKFISKVKQETTLQNPGNPYQVQKIKPGIEYVLDYNYIAYDGRLLKFVGEVGDHKAKLHVDIEPVKEIVSEPEAPEKPEVVAEEPEAPEIMESAEESYIESYKKTYKMVSELDPELNPGYEQIDKMKVAELLEFIRKNHGLRCYYGTTWAQRPKKAILQDIAKNGYSKENSEWLMRAYEVGELRDLCVKNYLSEEGTKKEIFDRLWERSSEFKSRILR